MPVNELGACELFVWELQRSGLVDRGQIDQIVGDFLRRNPRANEHALAEYLVQQQTLTPFQADRILNRKGQGLVLGPFVLIDSIGQGSMGQVYRATSKNDANHYAVKVLPRRNMWNVRMARRQVRSFSQFSHPAVVPFVEVGTAVGLHYLAWPLVEGRSLDAVVQEVGKLSVAETAQIGMQVAQGLSQAHHHNIMHGLIKPSNILIDENGQAHILDFGIGALLCENDGESLVDTMSTANTLTSGLDCASPESILEPTNRTAAGDQYSLGCVLYFCLTGRMPFPDAPAVEKMMAHQCKEPAPIRDFAPEVPEALCQVIQKMMSKKPEERYVGCDQVAEALEHYVGELSGTLAESAVVGAVSAGPRAGVPAARPVGRGLSGSSGRMNGLPSVPVMPAKPALPANLPAPVALNGGRPPVPRASFIGGMAATTPAPAKASVPIFPKRSTFAANADGAVQLTPAAPVMPPSPSGRMPAPPPFSANQPQTPGGWVPPEEEPRTVFGTLGVIAATLLLMVLVFFGAKLIMK